MSSIGTYVGGSAATILVPDFYHSLTPVIRTVQSKPNVHMNFGYD